MAEEAPPMGNKKLLVVAILLAAATVALYNYHVGAVREGATGKMVKLLRLNQDMLAGQKITADVLDVVAVPEGSAKLLGAVFTEQERAAVEGYVLNQSVQQGQWLLWSHVTGENEDKPSTAISESMVAVPLPLDQDRSLGDILRVGDRVNVLGLLPSGIGQDTYVAYRIIEAVKVHTIGGLGRNDGAAGSRRASRPEGLRSFDRVTIEVSPKASLELYNVLSHVRGGRVWLELRNPHEPLPIRSADAGWINPKLAAFAKAAK